MNKTASRLWRAALLSLIIEATAGASMFNDDFSTSGALSPDPFTNVNIEVSTRQTGFITGDWETLNGSAGAGGARGSYLANGISGLAGNVLLSRMEYNATGGSIIFQSLDSPDLGSGLIGAKYTVSGSMLLDDTQGASRLTDVSIHAQGYKVEFVLNDSHNSEGSGIRLQFITTNAIDWRWTLLFDGAELESGVASGFGFGKQVDITLTIDENSAATTAKVSFSYDATTINSGLYDISMNNVRREIRIYQRYYIVSAGANTDLILDIQSDDISVDILTVPERQAWTDIMVDEFSLLTSPWLTVASNAPTWSIAALSNNVWEASSDVLYWMDLTSSLGGLRGFPGYQAAYYDIQAGYASNNTLRLEAELKNDSGSWAAIGFANEIYNNGTAMDKNIGWVNIEGDGSGGGGTLWEGPSAGGSSAGLGTGFWNDGRINKVVLEYNLNDDGDGNGTLKAYVNGTLVATVSNTSAIGMPKYIFLVFANGGAGSVFYDSLRVSVDSKIVPVGVPVTIDVTPSGTLDFSWPSQSERFYDLESAESLTVLNWGVYSSYSNMPFVGAASSNTLTDVATDGPVRFFRVIEK